MKTITLFLAAILFGASLNAIAQPIANFDAVANFNTITAEQKAQAAAIRLLIVDRSVGSNINDGLTCLASPYATARNSCKRYLHPVPQFSNQPEIWAGTWPRVTISFFAWPGSGIPPELPCGQQANTWAQKLSCFTSYVVNNAASYDAVLMMPSYLDAEQPAAYITAMQNLQNQTGVQVILATSSLSRGNLGLSAFNDAVRQATGFAILDVADVETKDQTGQAWFDNKDGVPYTTTSCSENYPNDGINEPAIAPHYTRECDGGHLGNPDVGKIRIAKAIWWLLANLN